MRAKNTKFTCQQTAVVSEYVLFVELAPPAIISDQGQFSKHTVRQRWLASILSAILDDKQMIGLGSRSSGGMPRSAWQITSSAYASAWQIISSAVSFHAEHGIPPQDRQIIMSQVSKLLLNLDYHMILYCIQCCYQRQFFNQRLF